MSGANTAWINTVSRAIWTDDDPPRSFPRKGFVLIAWSNNYAILTMSKAWGGPFRVVSYRSSVACLNFADLLL
ncbi:hypothetical protein VN97_g11666 [Penicillium thymicola]|uniref:Uncharacterized protein n=1 Tax=Penicillium thymicola TaxID=293382 RepID=A0AAI9X307_PENTH|nr:hypothetical protein VN97_g11666 [Penicillium thymicola]